MTRTYHISHLRVRNIIFPLEHRSSARMSAETSLWPGYDADVCCVVTPRVSQTLSLARITRLTLLASFKLEVVKELGN